MTKKALFAVSTLGLGHATRTLPVIKHYLGQGYTLDIVSFGNALNYLKTELHGEKVRFFDLIDYPALERGSGRSFYVMLISDLITTSVRIRREQRFLKKLEQQTQYEFIFSDGKYGFFSEKTPCYLLSHQISFEIPKIFSFSQRIIDYFNKKSFQKFTKLFIPDYEDSRANLAGRLAHCKRLSEINHEYIGVISSFWTVAEEAGETIDFLFTISGYLHQHREGFIKKLIQEAESLPWRKVFILGDTEKKDYYHHDEAHQIEIYGFLAGKEKIRAFQNAKVIISRAGYTTIMDLIELEKPAILFPTPNQTEQEYLAKYLSEKNYFVIGKSSDSLVDLVDQLAGCEPFLPSRKTKEALTTLYHTIDA